MSQMTNNIDNVVNNNNDNELHDNLEDIDTNAWVMSGDMLSLPTKIFEDNTLSQYNRKIILQSELKNRDISFEPPVMD